MLLVAPFAACAAPGSFLWTVSSSPGDWLSASNWGGTLPTSSDDAYIVNGGTATIGAIGPVCNNLSLGGAAGAGTVQMTNGSLSAVYQYVGDSGTGSFTQSGGTNMLSGGLYLGYNTGSSGKYILNTGSLSADSQYLGYTGGATFNQSGGSNAVGSLCLGYTSGGNGTYSLSQTGVLSAGCEYVGCVSTATGLFQQSGGSNAVSYLFIGGSNDRYLLSGGTLQVNGGLANAGVLDGGGGTGVLSVAGSSLVDFSQGSIVNAGAMSVTIGPGSLVIVPSTFTTAAFQSFTTGAGVLVHTAGTTLAVSATDSVGGWGSINDPLNCQGSITATPGGAINLSGSLSILGTGTVSLGNGSVTTNDAASSIAAGSLASMNHYVGDSGAGSLAQAGTFTQSGGSNTVSSTLYLGYNFSDRGTYILSGSGVLSAAVQYLGYSGGGTFTQSGGSNTLSSGLYLGSNSGSSGAYTLSGTGFLSAPNQYIGMSGTGAFKQSGGSNTLSSGLYLGYSSGSSGSYSLGLSGAGSLSAPDQYVGYSGTGTFTQSGGSNTVSSALYLGFNPGNPGGNGTYKLSQTGVLSALSEYVGCDPTATGTFQQAGGSNTVSYLSISGSNGLYQLSGGTLQINGGLALADSGVLSGGSGAGVLSVAGSSLVDFSQGNIVNAGSMSVTIGPGSLVIVSSAFNAAAFHSFTTGAGVLVQTAGSVLMVNSGQGFGGWGSINDPVTCQGSITATSGGSINLNGSLDIAGTGTVSLGSGSVTTNDSASNITAGSLASMNHYVGCSAAGSSPQSGSFTQSGGSNTISSAGSNTASSALYLGYNSGDSGSYTLSGTGFLSAPTQFLGYCGTGTFTQSGGTNAAAYGLYLGQYPGSSGEYKLSGAGFLSAPSQYVGLSGAGTFTQSGGTNTVSTALYLGCSPGSSGTYNLDGGTLIVSAISGGPGTAVFNFNGGTLQAGAAFSTTQPVALATSGGNATIDTAGYAVTLAGPLSGPGGLVKVDSGTLTLTGSNSYTGGTTISGGTLQVDAGGASGSIPGGAVLDNGALAFNRSDNYSVSSPISGSGSVTQIGPGTLTFAAANNYSGTTLVSGGTLALANSAALQQSTLDTSGAGTVSFGSLTAATLGGLTGSGALALTNSASAPLALRVGNNGISTTYSGVLSGSGSLSKVGTGTLTLTASNNYSGGTSVMSGVLAVQGRAAIPSGSLLSIGANGSVVLGDPAYPEPLGLLSGGGSAGPLGSQSSGIGCPAAASDGQMAPALGGGVSAVPEPATTALLAAAAACGLAAAWRKRRRE